MKFKVGDKVRILQSASQDGINSVDLGKEAIVRVITSYDSMFIGVVPPCYCKGWWVNGDNITPVIKVGEQLLFDFMEQDYE